MAERPALRVELEGVLSTLDAMQQDAALRNDATKLLDFLQQVGLSTRRVVQHGPMHYCVIWTLPPFRTSQVQQAMTDAAPGVATDSTDGAGSSRGVPLQVCAGPGVTPCHTTSSP
jgi:hypothetical protein